MEIIQLKKDSLGLSARKYEIWADLSKGTSLRCAGEGRVIYSSLKVREHVAFNKMDKGTKVTLQEVTIGSKKETRNYYLKIHFNSVKFY